MFLFWVLIEFSYASGGTEKVISLIKNGGELTYSQLSILGNMMLQWTKTIWQIISDWFTTTLLPLLITLVNQIISYYKSWGK